MEAFKRDARLIPRPQPSQEQCITELRNQTRNILETFFATCLPCSDFRVETGATPRGASLRLICWKYLSKCRYTTERRQRTACLVHGDLETKAIRCDDAIRINLTSAQSLHLKHCSLKVTSMSCYFFAGIRTKNKQSMRCNRIKPLC